MFNINFKHLQNSIIEEVSSKYIGILEDEINKINSDNHLSQEEKKSKIDELYRASVPALAYEVSTKLIEANNNAIWNKLVELGLIKD